MTTLKCSRCTMLPTTWASRSYCFSSGAFMALVYPPDASREIWVVRGDLPSHHAAQHGKLLRRRDGRQGHLGWRVVVEPGVGADVPGLVHAFEKPPAPLLLPGEQRLAGHQGRGVAARRDVFDPGNQRAPRVLLAEQNRPRHHRVHECRAKGAGKTPAVRAHQVDVRFAVDLRAAEEEDVDPALADEIEQLARALGERVSGSFLQQRNAQRGTFLFYEKGSRSRNRRGGADGKVARVADQAGDHAGKEFFFPDQSNSSR